MPKPSSDTVAIASHVMHQEARLRLQAELIGTLVAMMAAAAGPNRNQVLDIVQEAGLRSIDHEEGDGSDPFQASAAKAMRADLDEILKLAKAEG